MLYKTRTFKGRATRAHARALCVPRFNIHINNPQVPAGAPQSFQELGAVCADIHFRGETLHSDARPARPRAPHLSPRSHRARAATARAAERELFLLTLQRGGARTHATEDPGPRAGLGTTLARSRRVPGP